ncbi:MAG TPA: thioredoxin domain-containing protein [Terriglobia bacterium]|nr:thioredoxin domain-containing protein [Terriglobia bacterium]
MRIQHSLFAAGLLVAVSLLGVQQNTRIVATVNGENITEQQMLQVATPELLKLEANRPQPQAAYDRARLEIQWRALNSIIEDKLITLEAAKNKMTREQLLNAEVDSNVQTPSPEEVDEFYEANKAQIPLPKAQALPQVRQYMIDSSRRRFREMLVTNMRRNFKVVTFLDPLRTDVATAGHPSRGPAAAPVTIVEFADFECPFCGGFYPTLKLIEKNYADKVRLVYRQFPLTNMHPNAQKAAEASLCANEQSRFWEYYDALFSDQSRLSVPALKQTAQTLGLNSAAFNTCLDSGKHAATIQKDRDEARKIGVSGTPTVFINGRLLGGRSYAEVQEVIDDELQRAARRK